MGLDYYWLTGKFINKDKGEDTDEWALSNGYISIVPVKFDFTAHDTIKKLNTWDLEIKELTKGIIAGLFGKSEYDHFYHYIFIRCNY